MPKSKRQKPLLTHFPEIHPLKPRADQTLNYVQPRRNKPKADGTPKPKMLKRKEK